MMSRTTFRVQVSHNRIRPLDSPAATTFIEIPSGAEEKHNAVMRGFVVVMPIKCPLTDLNSSRDCWSSRLTAHAMSAVFRLTANWEIGSITSLRSLERPIQDFKFCCFSRLSLVLDISFTWSKLADKLQGMKVPKDNRSITST